MRPVRKFFMVLLIYFISTVLLFPILSFTYSFFPWIYNHRTLLTIICCIIWGGLVGIFAILFKMI